MVLNWSQVSLTQAWIQVRSKHGDVENIHNKNSKFLVLGFGKFCEWSHSAIQTHLLSMKINSKAQLKYLVLLDEMMQCELLS